MRFKASSLERFKWCMTRSSCWLGEHLTTTKQSIKRTTVDSTSKGTSKTTRGLPQVEASPALISAKTTGWTKAFKASSWLRSLKTMAAKAFRSMPPLQRMPEPKWASNRFLRDISSR